MKKYLLTIFLLCALPSVVFADEKPLTLNLTAALKKAKEHQVLVIIANERVQQALARVGQSRAVLLPQINGTASQTRQTRDIRASGIPIPTSEDVIGPFNAYDARLRLTQTIFDAAAMERLQAARDNKNLSQAGLRKAEQDALSLVATLFVEARQAEQNKKFTTTVVERDRKHLNIVESRQKNGLSSIRELKQAQANYAQSVYQSQTAIKEAEEKRLDLLAALGLVAEQKIVFADNDNLPPFDTTSLNTTAESLKNQPDIIVAQEQEQQRKASHQVEQAEFWPKISTFADYGPSGVRPDDANETYTLGVQASVPFFQAGLRQAKVKETASQWRESQAVLADTRLNVRADLLTAVESVRAAEAFMIANEAHFALAQQQLTEADQRFKSGTGSDLDLTDAQTQLALLQYQQSEAQATYILARINLAHILGHVEDLVKEGESQ